jgi:hypothetical protein
MSKKPDDVPQDAWDAAVRCTGIGGGHEFAGVRDAQRQSIARTIMSAEKRGEERERAACEQVILDYPPEGFNAALFERTERHDEHDPFWKFEGDTGNWAAFMGEVLKPYAAAIRNRDVSATHKISEGS